MTCGDYFTLFLLLAVMTLAGYGVHKLRRIHLILYRWRDRSGLELSSLFRQIEALQGLYLDLGLQKSLPPTRNWAASPDFLWELSRHALEERPRTVVECGSGVSTLVLARCLQLNGVGKVYSLEHEPEHAEKTREQLERHGLGEWATVLDAPLRPHAIQGEVWPWYAEEMLPGEGGIDMLVIDGPPWHVRPLARYPAGPVLFPRLAARAAVFLDDAAREDEKAVLKRWHAEFPALRQTPRPCEKGCAVLDRGFSREAGKDRPPDLP
jgi:hypothetical protein